MRKKKKEKENTEGMNPACINCPVRLKPAGCGWLNSGLGCYHPIYRKAWLLEESLTKKDSVL